MINITKHQFLQFVRTKKDTDEKLTKATHHYLAYFDKYMSTGKKGNWNFAALLSGWFFYRRMYTQGLIISSLCKVIDKIIESITIKIPHIYPHIDKTYAENYASWVNCTISLVIIILCMRYADYMYLVFATKEISKGRTTSGVNRGIVIFFASILFPYWAWLIYSHLYP